LLMHWLATALLAFGLTQAAPAPAEVTYRADKNHSTVGFNAPILGFGKVTGKFTEFEIIIVHNEKDVTRSSVQVSIQAASVNTGVAERDAHLRTIDFFDAEKFPQITFSSTRIEALADGSFLAHGLLTLRGVQKQIALPFRIKVQSTKDDARTSLGVLARLTLNRRDYGITWKHSAVPDFVGDEIEVDLAITTRLGRLGRP